MTRRRGNNEGSIYKRQNGTYRAQVSLEGRRLGKTFKTRQEAQQWCRQMLNQIDDGLTYAATRLTLAEFLDSWLTSRKSSIGYSTWTQYERYARRQLKPYLGKVLLRGLRPDHIQRLYNHLIKNGTSPQSVRKLHSMLHSALEQAARTGLINRNPARAVIKPRAPIKEIKVLDESQISRMLVAVHGHQWEAVFQLAVATGMRQMELLGLKWTDLDWLRRTLKVERQLLRPRKGQPVQFSTTKTQYGRRMVDLGPQTIAVLRVHDQRQQEMRRAAGDRWQEHGLIFTSNVGTPVHPRNLLRYFKRMLAEAGLPEIRFHDLRHTAASLMLNHGIPPLVVSRRLGHARPSITLDIYGHLMPNMQAEAAQLIDELIMAVNPDHLT